MISLIKDSTSITYYDWYVLYIKILYFYRNYSTSDKLYIEYPTSDKPICIILNNNCIQLNDYRMLVDITSDKSIESALIELLYRNLYSISDTEPVFVSNNTITSEHINWIKQHTDITVPEKLKEFYTTFNIHIPISILTNVK